MRSRSEPTRPTSSPPHERIDDMKRIIAAGAALALLLPAAATLAQQPAKGKDAPPKAAATIPAAGAASTGKTLYPQSQFDLMLKERLAQGQAQDTPELRNAIREELNTRELLAREARRQGLDKTADMKTQMDLASQTVLVRAYVADWVQKNPVPESELKSEYEKIKTQIGDKEYHVRHILVEKEGEEKEVIDELQKGAKFDDLGQARSKDSGSKEEGG